MRPQELPPRPGHLVFPVHADMAAPHHPGARLRQRRDQASGLRVVQQHHVTGPDPGNQLHRVRRQHLRVMIGVRRAEGAAAGVAVDLVVQPLGDREEPGVAADHQPADRDVQILDIPDQYLQHLGDPATGRGRVDIPDGTPGQHLPDQVSAPGQQPVPRSADDGLQQRHRPPRHLHSRQQAHGIRPPALIGPGRWSRRSVPANVPVSTDAKSQPRSLTEDQAHRRRSRCSQKSLVALAGQTSVALGT